MIKVVKLFTYDQNFVSPGTIDPCPLAYTCIEWCFHMGPFVEGILTVCSNGSTIGQDGHHAYIWYKKHLKILFSTTKKVLRLNLLI